MIRMRSESNRVYIKNEQNDLIGQVEFPEIGYQKVRIQKVYVADAYQNTEILGRLMEETGKRLKRDGKKAYVACPIAKEWFENHIEYADVFVKYSKEK